MGRMPGMGEDRNEGEENVDVGKNNNNDSDDNDWWVDWLIKWERK